ncbi:MAG: HAMP domain-containing protein [Candidatus Abyssobacteria bacterium SURF_5]|uniref:histidine kinase n=1 Tax=Abyssobacteria bacterium (strain SURF_5) TaxID=2093360 RepID=A0A3A4NYZ2_ABYX5|nr:MAG: HAMP domain-containing protein [Candidatus Abyssubacteria bacterium SURF_5]
MKLTIRTKLLLGFLILMLLLVAGYVVAEYRLDKVKRANAKIREEWTEIRLVNEIQLSIDGCVKDLAGYFISGDDNERGMLLRKVRSTVQQVEQLEQLQVVREEEIREEKLHREQELAWINSFKKDFSEIESVLEEILTLEDLRANERAIHLFQELTEQSQTVIEDLKQFRSTAQDELERSIGIARREEQLSDRILMFSVAGMLLVGLACSIVFSKSIATPIIDLRNRSAQIGKGNFDYPKTVSSRDEIGDLDRSLQTMAMNLKELYEKLEDLVQERTEELKKANEHLQQLFNGITDGISVIDRQFKVVNTNSGLRNLIRLSEDAPQSHCYKTCAGRDTICERCPAAQTFNTGQSSAAEMIWHIHGQKLQVEIRTFPLSQNGRPPEMVIEYIKDVTEKRIMEQQLLQSSKLAAIGTLAAGIAHEINNPLSGVAYAAEAAANQLNSYAQKDEVCRYLKTILAEVYRCKAITQGLLDFSRESDTDRELCDMNEVVTSTLELLDFRLKKKRVVIQKNLHRDKAYLIGDAIRLKQVVFNVLCNSLDAVPDGGRIEVSVLKERDSVVTEIVDNGKGILPENLNNIFEPFYTTKPVGRGTGLGLAVCYGIIQKHKGEIRVSSPGKDRGTSVSIRLPDR